MDLWSIRRFVPAFLCAIKTMETEERLTKQQTFPSPGGNKICRFPGYYMKFLQVSSVNGVIYYYLYFGGIILHFTSLKVSQVYVKSTKHELEKRTVVKS